VDVHPPHQEIRSWKGFLLHLLTITIGLFIALTLEAAVESMHHRHLVRDARENLRQEITNNHKLYAENARRVQLNRDRLARDIEQLRDLRNRKKLENTRLSWGWEWNSYDDAAWQTARQSGAVTYMDPPWISNYSWVYAQQAYINSTALAIVAEETRAAAPLIAVQDAANLSPAEVNALLIKSVEIDLSFATLQTTMKALDDMYVATLKKP
jgi:hypothetical protein